MTLGSPTSPKPGPGAQFLPGFLMGDLPAPVTPQPRTFGVSGGGTETRSPLLAGMGEYTAYIVPLVILIKLYGVVNYCWSVQ